MDREEAEKFIIRQLGRGKPKNEIIRQLCEQSGIDWKRTAQFVEQVEIENQGKIAAKQSPMIISLGIMTMITGTLLTGYAIFATLEGRIIFLLKLPVPYLGNLMFFGIGIAMVFGGLRGMWSTIARIWSS